MTMFRQHLLTSAILALLASPAWAQEEEDEETRKAAELGTVTVTARGLSESLQEVPLPITAISADTIAEKGLQDVRDLAAYTPGFSFRSAFGRTGDRPVIRGMSNIQGQPNASFFIDGVFVSGSISGYNLDNLERVEVIRGPQSAQFGRRTFSGAINYITRKPGDVVRSNASFGLGQDGYVESKAMWSGPLIPGLLALEANVAYRNIDGRFFNQVSQEEDIGGEETQAAGWVLAFRPGDSVDATLRGNFTRNKDQHVPIFRQGHTLNNCFLPQPGTRLRGYFCGVIGLPATYGINTTQYSLAGYDAGLEREAYRYSLTIDWTLPNLWTLSSNSAYNDTTLFTAIDQDYSSIRGFGGAFETFGESRSYDYSQELRLASDGEGAISWQVGAYYYKEFSGQGFAGSLAGFDLPPGANRRPPVRNPVRPTGGTENIAWFGMLDWRLSEQWRAAFEIRYAEDKVGIGGVSQNTLTVAGAPTVFRRSFDLAEEFTSTTPRVSLSYQATPDLMVYGLASKGTKPGGFNTDVQSSILTEAARSELINAGFASFAEEKAWNYELGFKSDWLDGLLRLNGALFFIDWDNQQLTETRVVDRVDGLRFITSFTSNIGKSEVTGLELEAIWQLSETLRLNGSYTYLDTEIIEYISQDQADLFNGNGSAAGNRLPRVPKSSANIGINFDSHQLANGWFWFAGSDVSYESSRFAQIHNLAETGSSVVANMRVGVRPSERWTVSLFVRNAFDEDRAEDILRYVNPAVFIPVPNLPGLTPPVTVTNPRDFAITAQQPRLVGMQVRYDF